MPQTGAHGTPGHSMQSITPAGSQSVKSADTSSPVSTMRSGFSYTDMIIIAARLPVIIPQIFFPFCGFPTYLLHGAPPV